MGTIVNLIVLPPKQPCYMNVKKKMKGKPTHTNHTKKMISPSQKALVGIKRQYNIQASCTAGYKLCETDWCACLWVTASDRSMEAWQTITSHDLGEERK